MEAADWQTSERVGWLYSVGLIARIIAMWTHFKELFPILIYLCAWTLLAEFIFKLVTICMADAVSEFIFLSLVQYV